MLTVEILNKITKAGNGGYIDKSIIKEFVDQCNTILPEYGIDTKKAVAIWLANILHETGNLRITEENLNYSAQRLMQVWPSRFKTIAQANKYAKNPKALASNVYANRMGNGNEASGDGWTYRGRSYPQLTGKDAYRAVGKLMGYDLVKSPHLLADRSLGVLCGAAFWQWKGIKVTNSTTLAGVAKIWNGGTNGLAERQALYNAAMKFIVDATFDVAVSANVNRAGDTMAGSYTVSLEPEVDPITTPIENDPVVVSDTTNAILASRGDKNAYVEHVQTRLKQLGYGLDVDSKFGIMSRDAIMAFQADNGLTPTPDVLYQDTYHAIMISEQSKPSKEILANVTAKELKQMGSEPVKQADNIQKAGYIGAAFATVKGVSEMAPEGTFTSVDGFMAQFGVLKAITASIGEVWQFINANWWILLIVIAIAVFAYAKNIKKTTVEEYKDGSRNKA